MKIKKLATAISAILLTSYLPLSHAAQPNDNDWAPGRILVMPKSGLTNIEFDKILKSHNGKGKKLGQSNLHVVSVPVNSENAVLEKLKNNPHIKFAELDRKVSFSASSNDPYFGSEYHLTKIGADLAWDKTQGEGITIAILDSGVDPTHPDLQASLINGYNAYDNNTNTADVCGHGTAVAGSAAAITNNGIGVAGVAGKSKIMPIRIAYKDSTGSCYGYYSTITNGLIYAADNGAKIANISYGGVSGSSSIINAANYMQSKGGLVFVSAGNESVQSTTLPTPSMIVVSATDQNDNKTSWSNYGSYVSLAAPGSYIYTTSNGSSYGAWNGTSFSSPITAGVAALVMSANPALSYLDVQNILFSTAVDLGAVGKDIYFGYGRVNANAAVNLALNSVPSVDTVSPVVSITSPTPSVTVSGIVPISLNATDNIGVKNVELLINGNSVAIDSSTPFGFSWDSKGVNNGMANIQVVAYDEAGNKGQSSTVAVNVANESLPVIADTTPPVVSIVNPVAGSVSGTVNVSVNASDNSGAAGINQNLYVDNKLVKTVQGSSLAYSWNTRKLTGSHLLNAVAVDKAGNKSSTSVQVTIGGSSTGKNSNK
jgi:thermitase